LSELSDDYHILCGIQAELPRYITYNGRKNLRTAQLDFVVISKKGIILVEVKNWSDRFYRETDKIRPHEQVDRAARVLWIVIKSRWGWWKTQTPRVTSVLLSIQGNMRYDPNYKFVNVCDLNRINYFIENRKEQLSDKDVEKLVNMLKNHVTK
ncbi:MAG: nuclease-related domain-containing protein, partial [Nitrosopumilaceae archaeon]